MFCKYCGKQIQDDAFYCKYCGKTVKKAANKDASLHEPIEENHLKTSVKEKKVISKWLLVIPLIVAIIIFVVALVNRSTQIGNVEVAEASPQTEDTAQELTVTPEPIQESKEENSDESTAVEEDEEPVDGGDYTPLDFSDCNSFEEIINKLEGDMGYSYVVIGETEVLLVTNFVIAGNAAINTEIYIDKDNKPNYLGHVESDGTAYFLTVNNNKLFAGGHHDMRAYTIQSDKLLVDQEVIQEYDENGKEKYFYNSDVDKKEREQLADDSLWSRLLDEFNKGTQIVYTAATPQPTGTASDENIEIYRKFINNEITVEDKTYSDFFADILSEFEVVPQNYYYDVDEDGVNELLVDSVYGFDIFDVRDGELFWLAFGGGTSDMCRIYRGNDHTYVAHFNFGSVGWESLELTRYNGRGNKLESILLYAEYAGDSYTSNGYYKINNEIISMEEYKKYMESYSMVPTEEMEMAN